ncbi:MAG TPA: MBG domain-containing protein, partial [Bacteroidia bacterium]|nr:MBG domain-containing protein [Bacteroidia bacterium]
VAGALTNPNYNVTQFNTGTWTVGQRALTITADNQTKTYGDTFTFAGTEFGSSGLQNGETIGSVTLTSAGAVNTATVSGGPYAIVGSGATGGTFDIANYDVTYVDGQLTVTPRQIEVTAVGGSSIYGDSPANPGISADNMASFEVGQENTLLTGLYNSFGIGATTPAGDHALHVLGTLTNGNYEVVGRIDGNWHVGTKQLDITANDQSRIYGDSFAFNGTEFTSVGLINGDQVNWVGLASAATNEQLGVGTYAITASGALGTGLSNYHILYHGGSFTVTPRKVTVTANGGSSVYGQSPANPGLSADNLAHFDSIADLTGLYNSFGITSTTGAGVYTLNVLGTLTNPNYDVIGRVPGIWTVGQAALTITPHQAFRFVHQPNPPFSVFANGFQPGDGFWSLGGDLGYLTDANYYSLAGEYAVYPTGVNAANYNITFTQGTLTVVDNPMLLKDMANPIQFLQTKDDEEEKDAEKGEIRYEERKAEEKVISTLSTGDLQASAE